MDAVNASRAVIAVVVASGLAVLLGACGDDEGEGGHPSGVGNYCDVDEDCATGECYLGPGGGYCTTECAEEGSVAQCPLDTVCKPIQGGPRRCLLICGSESSCDGLDDCAADFCPIGSSCVSIGSTEHRGCEPDPT